jgi:hypothetical protein
MRVEVIRSKFSRSAEVRDENSRVILVISWGAHCLAPEAVRTIEAAFRSDPDWQPPLPSRPFRKA